MDKIKQDSNPTPERLEELGVTKWPIWTKAASDFPWSYEAAETCFFLEGEVVVTPKGGEPVTLGKGDLVTFPKGMSCRWEIKEPVRKHFSFEE